MQGAFNSSDEEGRTSSRLASSRSFIFRGLMKKVKSLEINFRDARRLMSIVTQVSYRVFVMLVLCVTLNLVESPLSGSSGYSFLTSSKCE